MNAPRLTLDIVSVFPEYFAPLHLSLVGKAIASGRIGLGVHDLRDWTHDRHHTTDDTPYGGGAGMVMKPEPWGEVLDHLVRGEVLDQSAEGPLMVFPTPSGQPFTQRIAEELSHERHIIFGCGRYEGIDRRVFEYAATLGRVRELSLGDYVLNGGEVAVLAMIESIVRLIPGVLGNPESLAEESHSPGQGGLLEYPVYTKPAVWRGRAVPEILLSGHHARIATWRREQSRQITQRIRPDLLAD